MSGRTGCCGRVNVLSPILLQASTCYKLYMCVIETGMCLDRCKGSLMLCPLHRGSFHPSTFFMKITIQFIYLFIYLFIFFFFIYFFFFLYIKPYMHYDKLFNLTLWLVCIEQVYYMRVGTSLSTFCSTQPCYSCSTSDDNLLKNIELFDRLSLRFSRRVLFIKDVIGSNEICLWAFYGHGKKLAEVCCTSIVYATDRKHTKVK